MLSLLIFIILLGIFGSGIYCFWLSIRPASVYDIETRVALDMEPYSHRLCIRACHIDTMADTYERITADEQLRDDIHQYVADFEAEVALRLKNTKQNTLNAYGGIRLH